MNEDIYVYSNFEYKDKVINVYTEIIYNGGTYFDDFYYDFDTENQKAQFIKRYLLRHVQSRFVTRRKN